MPLYTYKCKSCGHEFDEIIKYEKRDDPVPCKMCEKDSERMVAVPFGIKSEIDPKKDTVYTNKEIDKVVGKKSEEKWQGYDERWKKRYEERRKRRWGDRTPQDLNIPKENPVMHLGDNKEKTVRKEFVDALQEHRKNREAKGIKQFDGPGSIDT